MKKTRSKKWIETIEVLGRTVDGMGKGLDKGIVETVAAFNVHGILTTGSCEGHLRWGLPYPWIDVGVYEPKEWGSIKKWWKDEKKKKILHRKGRAEAEKLLLLVESFYHRRTTAWDVRLIISSFGWGQWRFRSAGGEMMELYSETVRKQYLLRAKKEMDAFTLFLKKRFFTN